MGLFCDKSAGWYWELQSERVCREGEGCESVSLATELQD